MYRYALKFQRIIKAFQQASAPARAICAICGEVVRLAESKVDNLASRVWLIFLPLLLSLIFRKSFETYWSKNVIEREGKLFRQITHPSPQFSHFSRKETAICQELVSNNIEKVNQSKIFFCQKLDKSNC